MASTLTAQDELILNKAPIKAWYANRMIRFRCIRACPKCGNLIKHCDLNDLGGGQCRIIRTCPCGNQAFCMTCCGSQHNGTLCDNNGGAICPRGLRGVQTRATLQP